VGDAELAAAYVVPPSAASSAISDMTIAGPEVVKRRLPASNLFILTSSSSGRRAGRDTSSDPERAL